MSRAFDTIDRGILLTDLKNILEPDTLHLVSLLLTDVTLQVRHNKTLGKPFKPDIGSPQGDCASPIWFIYYLHKALESTTLESPRNTALDIQHDHNYTTEDKHRKITKIQKAYTIDQQYADDISWITTSKTVTENIKNTIPTVLTERNLIINQDKTEEYSINRNSDDQKWKHCRYLGSLLGNQEDIKRRKQLASAAFNKNKKSLCSNKITLEIRIRIFEALISSIFLYNSELWTLKRTDIIKIDTFQRSFLRQIVRTKRINNTHLYNITKTDPWSITIQSKRLKWLGHMLRLPDEAPARKAFDEANNKNVKKVRGGQPLQWLKTVDRDLKNIDSKLEDAIKLAGDRDLYKSLVDRVRARSLSEQFPEVTEQLTEE